MINTPRQGYKTRNQKSRARTKRNLNMTQSITLTNSLSQMHTNNGKFDLKHLDDHLSQQEREQIEIKKKIHDINNILGQT